jgi:large subunit ribosomal protein L23
MRNDPYYVVKGPLLSEESTIQRDSKNHYTFKVDPRANKREIRDAIEKIFNVKVTSVNTMNYHGKFRRMRGIPGYRRDWKKAIVTLRKGDAIDLV